MMKNKVFSILVIMALVIIPVVSLANDAISVNIIQPTEGSTFEVGEDIEFVPEVSGGDPSSYEFVWTWGDGSQDSRFNDTPVIKSYDEEGLKSITLTVTDMDNNFGSYTIEINIEEEVEGLVVSNIEVSNITTSGATITWNTNHPATSRVIYDTISHSDIDESDTPNHGYANSTTRSDELVTSHSVTLSGLSSNTTYYFRVISTREI